MKKIFTITILLIAFHSCNASKNGHETILRNDEINAKVKKEIKALNDKIFQSINSNSPESIESFLVEDWQGTGFKEFKNGFEQIYNYLKTQNSLTDNYLVKDEFHIRGFEKNKKFDILTESTSINKYKLELSAFSDEMYVALLLSDDIENKLMYTFIYSKVKDNWTLIYFHVNQYSIKDMSGPDLFDKAKSQLDSGFIINAINYLTYADMCLKPALYFSGHILNYRMGNPENKGIQFLSGLIKEKYLF